MPLSCSRVPFDLQTIPSLSLHLLASSSSYHGRSGLQSQSDHTLYVREPANCHYSWIHSSGKQASGLLVDRMRTEKIPQEARSKTPGVHAEIFMNWFQVNAWKQCYFSKDYCSGIFTFFTKGQCNTEVGRDMICNKGPKKQNGTRTVAVIWHSLSRSLQNVQ